MINRVLKWAWSLIRFKFYHDHQSINMHDQNSGDLHVPQGLESIQLGMLHRTKTNTVTSHHVMCDTCHVMSQGHSGEAKLLHAKC